MRTTKSGRQTAPAFFVNLPHPNPPPARPREGGRVYTKTERLCGLWAADLGQTLPAETLHDTRRVLSDLLTRLDRPLPVETA